jgi:hypothetical protein
MANTKISDLSAGAVVSATDLIPNVQAVGVGPVKTTAAQIKTFTSAAPTITGHPTIEGVTSTGATGTGKIVFDTTPTFATNMTAPLVIGGTGTTSTLTFRTTSGVGTTGSDIIFQSGNNGATELMRILNSGQMGLSTTPKAGVRLQVGSGEIIGFAGIQGYITANAYFSSTYKYIVNGEASYYRQNAGEHLWYTAVSGVADADITFGNAKMALDINGNLGIGELAPGTYGNLVASSGSTGGPLLTLRNTRTSVGAGESLGALNFYSSDSSTGGAGVRAFMKAVESGGFGLNYNLIFGTGASADATEQARIDSIGNFLLGTTSSPTTGTQCFTIETGTAPTASPADTVTLYSSDRSAGNTIPSIYCEGSGVTNAGITSTTVTHKIAVRVNGTIYYLLATTNAT